MAVRSASLLVLLAFVVAAALAQANSPPNVAGQWTDGKCNLIPGSDQFYQIRTYFFSAVNTKTLSGTYELHQQVFQDVSCAAALEQFRIVEKGSFVLGTKASVEKFWNIDYTVSSRTLQPFTQSAVNELNSYVTCKFPQTFVPNLQVDISAVTCDVLHVNAIGSCSIIYDIVRRDSALLFLGNRFPGQPPLFVAPCIPVCRPSTYDRFSLKQVTTPPPPPTQPVLAPNTAGTGVVFPIANAVGPINLINYASDDNAASSLVASVAMIAVVVAALLM